MAAAALGSSGSGLPQRVLVLLDVSLRVPCVFIIDNIFNSQSGPGPGPPGPGPGDSGWSGASASGSVVVRILGVVLALVVLLLSQKALLRFYRLFLVVVVAMASILINYYASSLVEESVWAGPSERQRGHAPWLLPWGAAGGAAVRWLWLLSVQLLLAVSYVFLLELRWASLWVGLLLLDVLAPLWGRAVPLPPEARRALAWCSGAALAAGTAAALAARLRRCYYSCRYVYLLLRHMYRIYGLQLLLEDTWRRIRIPDVLRLFWITRLATQALILLYVVRYAPTQPGYHPHTGNHAGYHPHTGNHRNQVLVDQVSQ